ncbi:MAG: PAS domain S-box protein, partial [Myxococcales bacterium]
MSKLPAVEKEGRSSADCEKGRMEKALEESELYFRTLFAKSRVTMLLVDPSDGRIVDANEASSTYYGYPLEQLRRMHIYEINMLTPQEISDEMAQAKIEERWHFFFRHRLASGEVRDVEVHSGPLNIAGSTLLYSIIHDITDRRRLEDERRKLSLAVEQSPVSIVITDVDGHIEYANPCFTEQTGYSLAEAMGQDSRLLKSSDTSPADQAELWSTISGGQTWRGTFHNRKKDGTSYWESAQIAPIFDSGGRITHYLGVEENITPLKAAETALRESEARYRSALTALAEGVLVYDVHGTLVTVNPAAARILGLTTDECLARTVDDAAWRMVTPDGTPWSPSELPSAVSLRDGQPRRDVLVGVFRPDGGLRWITVSTEPIRDLGTDTLQAVVVSFNDITARKAAEDSLRESEARLTRVLDGTDDGFWDWNVLTGETVFSRRWSEMLGYQAGEIASHISSWGQMVHPDDLARSTAALHAHFAGETSRYECEHRFRTMSGEWLWILDRGKVTERDPEGNPLRMAGTHTDTTERRHLQDRLNAILLEQNVILEHTSVGISRLQDRKLVWMNRKMLEMFQYSAEEMVGQSIRILHPTQESFEEMGAHWYPVLIQGGEYRTEREMCRKDGSLIWIRIHGKAVDPGDPTAGSIWICEDISERRDAEQQLKEAMLAAEAANLAKSQFLANMSHEIRTPMNGVLGMTSLLLDTELTETQREFAGIIRSSTEALLTVINDILDFSKIEAGCIDIETRQFDLTAVLDDTLDMFALRASEKGLELTYLAADDVPELVSGDPARLRQVLVNLVGNAIKFTEQGQVAIRVTCETVDAACVVRFAVRDTGIGIEEETMRRLFRPFVQADSSHTRRFGGTGLGLAISKDLAERMGGHIGVDSEPAKGSTFWFSVPLGVVRQEGLSKERFDVPVLLVDHQVSSRESMASMLDRRNCARLLKYCSLSRSFS